MKRLLYILIVVILASFSFESCCKLNNPVPKEAVCGEQYTITNDDPIDSNTDTNTDPFGITDSEDDEDHDKEDTSN